MECRVDECLPTLRLEVAVVSRAIDPQQLLNSVEQTDDGKANDRIGLDIAKHKPHTFEELEDWEGLNFDLIVTLSPEAHHKALELTRTMAADVEYWPTPDPTGMEGNREQKLAAYREVCDGLFMRIRRRFAKAGAASG